MYHLIKLLLDKIITIKILLEIVKNTCTIREIKYSPNGGTFYWHKVFLVILKITLTF